MALSYSFTDNVSYGTEDINAITRDLTGAGVAPFPTQDTYNVSDLNTLTEALASSGVSLNGCLCSKSGDTVTVAEGIIFFENGVRMRVDSEGCSVTVPQNIAGYIYAYFNQSLQTGGIEFAADLPSDIYCVQLASISADGTLTDTRCFARSKVATFGANATLDTVLESVNPPIQENDGLITRQLNADISKFNYAFINMDYNYGIFDIKQNRFIIVYYSAPGSARIVTLNSTQLLNSSSGKIYVYIRNNTLVAYQYSDYTADVYAEKPITVTLI